MDIQLISTLLYVLAGLFLLQSIFTIILYFVLSGKLRKVEDETIKISQRSAGQIRNFRALLVRINRAFQILPALEKSFTKVLDYAVEKLQVVDEYTESTMQKSVVQIEEIGRKIEVSLKQFNRQTTQVERIIRNPAINASALLHGLVVGFRELFKSTRAFQPATHSPEDDAFI